MSGGARGGGLSLFPGTGGWGGGEGAHSCLRVALPLVCGQSVVPHACTCHKLGPVLPAVGPFWAQLVTGAGLRMAGPKP